MAIASRPTAILASWSLPYRRWTIDNDYFDRQLTRPRDLPPIFHFFLCCSPQCWLTINKRSWNRNLFDLSVDCSFFGNLVLFYFFRDGRTRPAEQRKNLNLKKVNCLCVPYKLPPAKDSNRWEREGHIYRSWGIRTQNSELILGSILGKNAPAWISVQSGGVNPICCAP